MLEEPYEVENESNRWASKYRGETCKFEDKALGTMDGRRPEIEGPIDGAVRGA